MTCRSCGKVIRFDKPACPDCGARLPSLAPPFERTVDRYRNERKRYETGALSRPEFESSLKKLIVSHKGRFWTLGANTGTWFVNDGNRWIAADPPIVDNTLRNAAASSAIPAANRSRPASRRGAKKTPMSDEWTSAALDFTIKGIAFAADDSHIIATCFDPFAPVLAIGADTTGSLRVTEDKYLLDAVSVAREGHAIFCSAVGRTKSKVYLWDAKIDSDAINIPTSVVYESDVMIGGIATAADASRLFLGMSNGHLVAVNVATGRVTATLTASDKALGHVAASPNGHFVATAGRFDSHFSLWDMKSGTKITKVGDGMVSSLAISADGLSVAAVASSKLVVRSIPGASERLRIGTDGVEAIDCAAFSRDGRRIFTGGHSGVTATITAWDAVSGKRLSEVGRISDRAERLVVSNDGRLLGASAADNKIRVWKL